MIPIWGSIKQPGPVTLVGVSVDGRVSYWADVEELSGASVLFIGVVTFADKWALRKLSTKRKT